MFMNSDPHGVNQKSELAPGTYLAMATVYAPTAGVSAAVLVEFMLESIREVLVAEVLIHGPDGGLYYRNFMKLQDGMWRDSFGEKSFSLGELLPAEILEFTELERTQLGAYVVGGVQ